MKNLSLLLYKTIYSPFWYKIILLVLNNYSVICRLLAVVLLFGVASFLLAARKASTKNLYGTKLSQKEQKCNGHASLCSKTLPEISIAMTHNAFNVSGKYKFPNQANNITQQLNDGIRGLMIDVYSHPKASKVYHRFAIMGSEKLEDVLGEIFGFLSSHPNEVVVIIFENAASDEEIMGSIKNVGLLHYAYIHEGKWPTLAEMIAKNQRLVMMLESSDGDLPQELLYAWEHTFDTPYTFKHVSEFNANVNRGGEGKRTFYLLNHWISSRLGLPSKKGAVKANNKNTLQQRIKDCENTHKRRINFLGVDFYNIGDVLSVTDSLNSLD